MPSNKTATEIKRISRWTIKIASFVTLDTYGIYAYNNWIIFRITSSHISKAKIDEIIKASLKSTSILGK